ncbi:MAG TPA: aminotransferase DegT [Bacteroidales bacterium]|nr:MAG: aminotransferase DegT [Bacteroidetes bacterium GWE2_42_24]OFY26108.1 MAG: aminotransferase DegT [Bacteroidetes bacterium GWF2_43_11]HAQ65247.1 aminotransferase DegT [Bacteroidales bacterium]HBZ65420.1 LegC family aminotransferase [Bacteroidales bacterium]
MNSYGNIVDFVRETYLEPEAFIPLHEPRFIGNERKYLNECIDTNFVSSVGEFVSRFEKLCADFTGARYAVAAMNGTAALHMALLINGVERGDEVITQSLTFIATANAISYTGAHPVFLDVDRDTMGLSPKAVEAWLKQNAEMRASKSNQQSTDSSKLSAFNKFTNRRIAACVPMHTFGHPVYLEELVRVLDQYNIPLIEDAAESLGSYTGDRHTGTIGRCGILSFNGNKVITTGGGGMILTNDESLAKMAKHLTTQAKVPHRWEFRHDFVGYNYRLTNLAAALGCAQIESLDYLLQLKRDLAAKYKAFFINTPWQFFSEREGTRSNYWLNVILASDRHERDEILQYTNDHGVMTRPIWELMTDMPMFEYCQKDELKNSRWLADRVVNLPSSAVVKGDEKMV